MNGPMALGVVAVLLLANAFFVGAEFALVSARRTQIEPWADAGSRSARRALAAMDEVALMMAGAQLGITACSLGIGAVGEPIVAGLLVEPFERAGLPTGLVHPVAFGLALVVVTALHVVVGEMVPKNLTLAAPDRAALALGPALARLVGLVRPVVSGLNAVANSLVRLAGVQPRDDVASSVSRSEVEDLVAESHREGLMDPDEHELVREAIAFSDRLASTVVIPTERIVSVPSDASAEDVEELAGRTGFSRFPVGSPDGGLVGYVHLKDVIAVGPPDRSRALDRRLIRPLPRVGVHAQLTTVLAALQRSRTHLALAVDDRGQPHGMVSMDDVLASVVPERPDRNG